LGMDSIGIISNPSLPPLSIYFIAMYLPRAVTQSGSINIQIILQRKRPSWGTNQRPEIIFVF
jgi:hypothetical protein